MSSITILSQGTLGYTVCTFAWAVIWHIVLFEQQYKSFGYIRGEPNFVVGFITIAMQGLILTWLYRSFKLGAVPYAFSMGAFFWTSHVLAFVAKQAIVDEKRFILMESFYLFVQFGLYGVVLRYIHGGARNNKRRA